MEEGIASTTCSADYLVSDHHVCGKHSTLSPLVLIMMVKMVAGASAQRVSAEFSLTLRKTFKNPVMWLSSWKKGGHYCSWQGVKGDNTTGHVTRFRPPIPIL